MSVEPIRETDYWRSLDEKLEGRSHALEVDERLRRSIEELIAGGVDRRDFLRLMGASLGLAGLAGCRRPEIKILPYDKRPEDVAIGLPTFYATSLPRAGSAFPVLVETREGRPIKIEGNPKHPASLGATDLHAQSAILDLYDPDRSVGVFRSGETSTLDEFESFARPRFRAIGRNQGKGLAFLAGDQNSLALDLLREHIKNRFPQATWHVYEPLDPRNLREGAKLAFGRRCGPRYRFDRAEIVLTLDCDALGTEDAGIEHVSGFSKRRRVEAAGDRMNRLYAIESRYTITGGVADHRLPWPTSQVGDYVLALARGLIRHGLKELDPSVRKAVEAAKIAAAPEGPWIEAVADDLLTHRKKSIVVAGRSQPPEVQALVLAINAALGNLGETIEMVEDDREEAGTIAELAEAIRERKVETLVVLGGNPAYDAPAELDFAKLLTTVAETIRLGTHLDETSARATWHLSTTHALESWDLTVAADGSPSAVQPLIEPLFDGRSPLEIVARLTGFETRDPYEIVRKAFRRLSEDRREDFETSWREFLHDGFMGDRQTFRPFAAKLDGEAVARAIGSRRVAAAVSAENLELVFHRDSKVDDGRHANNGWLQELPDPITKLTWDNAALISPKLARRLEIGDGDLLRLSLGERSLEIAALIAPGQAEHSVAVALGYGVDRAGRVCRGAGFDAYRLRTGDAPEVAVGLSIAKTGKTYPLARTQEHHRMEGREPIRELELVSIGKLAASEERHPDIYQEHRPKFAGEQQWGMAIDLNACTGCNACVVACQAENNIPIVGKKEIERGREMHWIRIDRYYSGSEDDPDLLHQPVACQHCENAPCETVCPVNAAVHNSEGLNLQVYNRCVGTRYCGNNCPYKVRRFNFFDYNQRPLDRLELGPLASKGTPETLRMRMNPDVTVRMRGVMEKCTYCVQRIERARIGARVAAGESAEVRIDDGTIVPACAQACPARAIVFGDVSDPKSRVSVVKRQGRETGRDYELLGETNTKPRTTYQARLRNPHPAFSTASEPRVRA